MLKYRMIFVVLAIVSVLAICQVQSLAADVSALRLVPFPKSVTLNSGSYAFSNGMTISVPDSQSTIQAAQDLVSNIRTVFKVKCRIKVVPQQKATYFRLHTGLTPGLIPTVPSNLEGYALAVSTNGIEVRSASRAGLLNGIQTLRQLVIANNNNGGIPAVSISDYPSLQYRGFQDDITRGRNSKLNTLELQVRNARYLRMNFFTCYNEYQYEFKKNPVIGPVDGSLTAEDLKALVAYSKNYDVDVVGGQQSFGHFYHILKHPEYAALREGSDCLDPTNEGTYKLLDEMYSEQIPLLDCNLFNVSCDETVELGTGPSKPLADKIGVGAVYAQHMKRIHDLITNKYGKRMMMWGDIISQHPENLKDIPSDTVMLSWGYHPAPSFDYAVIPFKESGYDFFVCPGVSSWSRILPDFGCAITNIHNYVLSGVKYGAMGMLNTSWGDDNENLMGYNWHGIAWGGECAWSGSKTKIEDFNRRIGAVLFGEKGSDFGQAIELLTKTHSMAGYSGMNDGRFWQGDFGDLPIDKQFAGRQARKLLSIVEPALKHLKAAKHNATINADQLDYFIFGADRMKTIATRWLDYIDASAAYNKAYQNRKSGSGDIAKAITILTRVRNEHLSLKNRYIALWNREARPFSLNNVLARYDNLINRYDTLIAGLKGAQDNLKAGKELPAPDTFGMGIVEMGVRHSTIDSISNAAYASDAPWVCSDFKKRVGLTISAGDNDRCDQPIEIEVPGINNLSKGVRLAQVDSTGNQTPVAAQILTVDKKSRLAFIASGDMAKGSSRSYFLYYDPSSKIADTAAGAVSITDAPDGGKWMENSKLRLMVGTEGGHIYRWEVKSLNNLDLTHPGERDWSGFADISGESRNAKNKIEVVADGPVLARIRLTDPLGVIKTISLWQDTQWAEVDLGSPTSWFCNYDDSTIMGSTSKTPGSYILSNGSTGPLKPMGGDLSCTSYADGLFWGAKYVAGGPMIGMATPEVGTTIIVGPGDGMGAVSLNYGNQTSHFVIYGGTSPANPAAAMEKLRNTTNYKVWPKITVFTAQNK